jgi:tetratricopeptide (TPR) repeat protein
MMDPSSHRFTRVTAALALFLAGLSPSGQAAHPIAEQQQSDAASSHWEQGLELAQTGQLQAAEEQLRTAAAMKPDNAEYLSSLATVLAMQRKFEESTALFEKALRLNPADLLSRRHLSANLWQLHRYPEAKQQLERILRADPGDAQTKLLLGLVSEKTGDYSESRTMLSSIPDLVRAQPEALLSLAKSYYRVGERAKAADTLSKLAEGRESTAGALLGARLADEMQDYETAERLIPALPRDSPDFRAARYRLAVIRFHSKQYEQSGLILQDLINAGLKNGEVLRLAGWCYHKTNRDEDAIAIFREAIQLDPADEKNFLDLGMLLLEKGKFSPALELANRMVGAFPRSSDAFALLGSVEFASERFTDAVETYSKALELNPDSGDAMLGLAKAQAAAGAADQARKTLGEAMRRFPGRAVFELELARLLLRESERPGSPQQARAETLLRAAAKHDPNLAEVQYQLGELALRRGQTAAATAHFENEVKNSPGSAKAHFSLARAYRRAGRTEDAARETAVYDKLKDEANSAAKNSSQNVDPGE